MSRPRARAASATLAILGGLVLTLRGQDASRLQILSGVGLPAIDEGVLADDTHRPGSPEALRRAAFRVTVDRDGPRVARSNSRPGRLIVRFRDEAAMSDRRAAVRAAS